MIVFCMDGLVLAGVATSLTGGALTATDVMCSAPWCGVDWWIG